MPQLQFFDFRDDSQQFWDEIFATQKDAAQSLAHKLVSEAVRDENGCLVTETTAIRKVRFAGSQFAAYRFIYCALTETAASSDQVIRHRCHNRRCINPEHLTIGTKADNKHDDWEYWANGIDRDYLGTVAMHP